LKKCAWQKGIAASGGGRVMVASAREPATANFPAEREEEREGQRQPGGTAGRVQVAQPEKAKKRQAVPSSRSARPDEGTKGAIRRLPQQARM